MPILTVPRVTRIAVGMTCDCCGKTDRDGLNDFAIEHTLGYDSPCDMTKVSAAICDDCLVDIVLARVPGAIFTNASGEAVTRDEIEQALADKRARAVRRAAG